MPPNKKNFFAKKFAFPRTLTQKTNTNLEISKKNFSSLDQTWVSISSDDPYSKNTCDSTLFESTFEGKKLGKSRLELVSSNLTKRARRTRFFQKDKETLAIKRLAI